MKDIGIVVAKNDRCHHLLTLYDFSFCWTQMEMLTFFHAVIMNGTGVFKPQKDVKAHKRSPYKQLNGRYHISNTVASEGLE